MRGNWKTVTNKDLYKLTKEKLWSETLERRGMKLLGHLGRSPEETPAKPALKEIPKPQQKNKVGRPNLTRLKKIKNDQILKRTIAEDHLENILKLAIKRDHFGSRHENLKAIATGCNP